MGGRGEYTFTVSIRPVWHVPTWSPSNSTSVCGFAECLIHLLWCLIQHGLCPGNVCEGRRSAALHACHGFAGLTMFLMQTALYSLSPSQPECPGPEARRRDASVPIPTLTLTPNHPLLERLLLIPMTLTTWPRKSGCPREKCFHQETQPEFHRVRCSDFPWVVWLGQTIDQPKRQGKTPGLIPITREQPRC